MTLNVLGDSNVNSPMLQLKIGHQDASVLPATTSNNATKQTPTAATLKLQMSIYYPNGWNKLRCLKKNAKYSMRQHYLRASIQNTFNQ
eukprot:scaffold2831_cov74-Skeletonema_menzelii.AAC.1